MCSPSGNAEPLPVRRGFAVSQACHCRPRWIGASVWALFCGLCLASASPARETGGTLRGVVTGPGGRAVPAAIIQLSGEHRAVTLKADREGRFSASGLPRGTWTLTCRAEGCFQQLPATGAPFPAGRPVYPTIEIREREVAVELRMLRCAFLKGRLLAPDGPGCSWRSGRCGPTREAPIASRWTTMGTSQSVSSVPVSAMRPLAG